MNKYLILSTSFFFKKKIKKKNFYFINNPKSLSLKKVKKINPDIIFVPHWNWKINNDICHNYKVIIFHSTPLPYGRGGTPIQNMIQRGHKKTKICAIEARDKYDSGKIFLEKNMSLSGTANIIFNRMYKIILKMIFSMVKKLPKPRRQKGSTLLFKRRTCSDSNLKGLQSIEQMYDHIRMLDFDKKNFPKAYLELKKIKFVFSKAKILKNKIIAHCVIQKNN